MTITNDTYFATQLAKHRRRRSLTQIELSGLSAVSVRAIRNLEQGKVALPRKDTVRLLADALRLTGEERISFSMAAACHRQTAPVDTPLAPMAGPPLRGRAAELDILLRQLAAPQGRVVSITGFWGVGKTRLAAATAQALRSGQAAPVFWLSRRPDADVAAAHLAGLIGDQDTVLVLDGADNGADGAVSHEAVWALLRDCPRLRILRTSRSDDNGFQLALTPLPVPRADDRASIEASPALRMLLDLIPGFPAPDAVSDRVLLKLAEVCRSLDGLPGALAAAAAWYGIVGLDQLAEMARSEPELLASHPAEDGEDPESVILGMLGALGAEHREYLSGLASLPGSWSVHEAAERLGVARVRLAGAVHAFRQIGLIRSEPDGAGPLEFGVLRLVRAILQPAAHRDRAGSR
ncbi:helix-turn-helix domain-containing protein [Catenulispora subtropica]|uniref:Helix-turn-helix domain-containing protein n=1 Tax=Catenulispora subtropica TaxID=450798 RepID=A0ABP5DMP1_9ACTN